MARIRTLLATTMLANTAHGFSHVHLRQLYISCVNYTPAWTGKQYQYAPREYNKEYSASSVPPHQSMPSKLRLPSPQFTFNFKSNPHPEMCQSQAQRSNGFPMNGERTGPLPASNTIQNLKKSTNRQTISSCLRTHRSLPYWHKFPPRRKMALETAGGIPIYPTLGNRSNKTLQTIFPFLIILSTFTLTVPSGFQRAGAAAVGFRGRNEVFHKADMQKSLTSSESQISTSRNTQKLTPCTSSRIAHQPCPHNYLQSTYQPNSMLPSFKPSLAKAWYWCSYFSTGCIYASEAKTIYFIRSETVRFQCRWLQSSATQEVFFRCLFRASARLNDFRHPPIHNPSSPGTAYGGSSTDIFGNIWRYRTKSCHGTPLQQISESLGMCVLMCLRKSGIRPLSCLYSQSITGQTRLFSLSLRTRQRESLSWISST